MTEQLSNYRIDGYIKADPQRSVATLSRTGETLTLPPAVDLRPQCSPVENQGQVGSCTANAVVGALEYLQIASGGEFADLSRMFVYYNARRFLGWEEHDGGADMHHVVAALLAYGVVPESMWPYDEHRWKLKPDETLYQGAVRFPGLHYARVSKTDERKYVLATGLPIILGMGVPPELFRQGGRENYMPAPANGDWEQPRGGHAMLIVGYDDAHRVWIVRNSWGPDWGDNGHVYIDYDVIDHYATANDFWTIGPLDRNRFFTLNGPSAEDMHIQTVKAAPASVQASVERHKQTIRNELESALDEARSGLRERLRGPGAGGGYDKGPGAGGGYDKGPGAGGGYDKGPGAGGGYDKGPEAGGGYDD